MLGTGHPCILAPNAEAEKGPNIARRALTQLFDQYVKAGEVAVMRRATTFVYEKLMVCLVRQCTGTCPWPV